MGRPGRSGGARPGAGRPRKDADENAPAAPRGLVLLPPTRKEPRLISTLESVTSHARWLTEQLLAGTIDPIIAREVKEQHRTMLAAMRQKHSQSELEQMRQLVTRAEKAAEQRARNTVSDTYDTSADIGLIRRMPADA